MAARVPFFVFFGLSFNGPTNVTLSVGTFDGLAAGLRGIKTPPPRLQYERGNVLILSMCFWLR